MIWVTRNRKTFIVQCCRSVWVNRPSFHSQSLGILGLKYKRSSGFSTVQHFATFSLKVGCQHSQFLSRPGFPSQEMRSIFKRKAILTPPHSHTLISSHQPEFEYLNTKS